MFKRFCNAAILSLVLPLAVAGAAEARPGGSFRGGFSAHKSSVSRSTAAPRQPSFGSFGKRPAEVPAASRTPQRDSAMARDLERRAAQDQALRSYDARRATASGAGAAASASRYGNVAGAATGAAAGAGIAAAGAAHGAPPPLPPLDPVLPGGRTGGNGGHFGHGQPSGATSAAAPVVIRESNNGWLWGIGGFMLGRATGGHGAPAPATAPAAPAPAPATEAVDASGAQVATYPAGASPSAAAGGMERKKEGSWLGKFAVLALAGGLAWLAWKAFRLMAAAQEVKKHANYSFERN